MEKLALVINESLSYLDKEVERVIEEFSFKRSDMNISTEFKDIPKNGMFGSPFLVLDLTEKNDLKRFVELIDKNKKIFKNHFWGNGLIIKTIHNQGTSKIQKLVEKNNGIIISKQKPNEVINDFLKKYTLRKTVENFLKDFVREETEILLSLEQSLKELSTSQLKELSEQDILNFLPHKQGSIPPWDFVERLFDSSIEKTLETFDRTYEHYYPLVLLTILKNKMNLFYHYSILQTLSISNSEKSKILKVNPYSFQTFSKLKKKPSIESIIKICYLVYSAEEDFKSGLKFAQKEYFENLLIRIKLLLKG